MIFCRNKAFTAVLCTILSLTSGKESLSSNLLQSVWQESTDIYARPVANDFLNGSTLHVSTTPYWKVRKIPFSNQYSDWGNIYPIYEDILFSRHNISKRQVANETNPNFCTDPSTSHCGEFLNSKYRTFDGTCNNVNNPAWGAVNRSLNRLIQPGYDDGIGVPRGGFGRRLPNPRVISVTVHPDIPVMTMRLTNMVPQFGQFLSHDITLTPEENSPCCSTTSSNADCWPIPISSADPFYSRFSQTCMNFTRSTACYQTSVRQQMNIITAYIDASQIYGSSNQRASTLRKFEGGMMHTHKSLAGFLPLAKNLKLKVKGPFAAGDDRVNAMPGLAVMHTVFIMEHNRIAKGFRLRGWSDEQIYQESRRLVTAEFQNIVYNEYLPIILGPGAMLKYELDVGLNFSEYNQTVDATIFNSFATAAYRFGHSMISGLVRLISATNQVVGTYQVADQYFKSAQITQSNGQGYDLILRGLMTQNAPEMDRFVTAGVTNFLFKSQTSGFGSDLIARNIQRGRDHGLKNYNDYRMVCGGSDLSNSGSLVPPNITPDGWSLVGQLYRSPLDIDLFVGGLIEIPVAGGISGPTFTCLKALQFSRLKNGDRYFFTHNSNTGFDANQLNEIRTRRLSDIICQNSHQPDAPVNAFLVPSANNPTVSCSDRGRNQLSLNLFP